MIVSEIGGRSAKALESPVQPACKFDGVLSKLPEGSVVAVVHMLGSLCPITLGHVQCYIEARHILLDDVPAAPRPARLERFDECIGLVSVNADRFVARKLREKGQKALNYKERADMVRLATAQYPWLDFADSLGNEERVLPLKFPHLRFEFFDMNGADDVAKYHKWTYTGPRNRMIVMGRPGYTEAVLQGMRRSKISPEDGNCFLGPELEDVSSTAARDASARGDCDALLAMLHPSVARWMLRNDGHEPVSPSGADA